MSAIYTDEDHRNEKIKEKVISLITVMTFFLFLFLYLRTTVKSDGKCEAREQGDNMQQMVQLAGNQTVGNAAPGIYTHVVFTPTTPLSTRPDRCMP